MYYSKKQVTIVAVVVVAIGLFCGLKISTVYHTQKNLKMAKKSVCTGIAESAFEAVQTPVRNETKVSSAAEEDNLVEVSEYAVEETSNCVGNLYGEGGLFGTINYNGTESAVVAGTSQESLEYQAMIHRASRPEHIVVLGHNYADGSVFGCLAINHSEGVQVSLADLNGMEISYSVVSSEWVAEETYDTAEYISNLFEEDSSDLVLVTCQKKDGSRGRLIVRCEQNV